MWRRTKDGSVVDDSGNVICFCLDRFVHDICLGDCCFVCGAKPGGVPVNDEHVIPVWILRRGDLLARSVTLPNGTTVRYDRYTVPCCTSRDTLIMGQVLPLP
jgi:hypothetical protein